MKDGAKSKAELLGELAELRRQMAELATSKAGHPPAPAALRAAEQTCRVLAELSPDFIFIVDDAGRIQYVNPSGAKEVGAAPETLVGKRIEEVFPGETPERRRAEGALVVSRAELSAIFEDAPVMMILINGGARVRQVNRAAAEFAQRPPEEMIGLRVGEALGCLRALDDPRGCRHSLFCEVCEVRHAILDTARASRSHHRIETRLPFREGAQERGKHFLVSTFPLRAAGQPMVLLCLEDTTERNRAEEALHESQRTLFTLMSNLPGLAYRCRNDPDRTMELASEGCLELTGYPPADLVGNATLSYAQLIHPDDRERVWNEVQAVLRDDRPFHLLYRITPASGEEKWVWEKGRGVRAPDGTLRALEGFITDITERKKADEERESMQALLLHAQKMEAIGILAGGVAHDFNNLLTAIHGHAELAMGDLDETHPLRKDLDRIRLTALRGASLTSQLLLFSRRQPFKSVPLHLNWTVRNLLEMLERVIGEDIVIRTELEPGLWTVRGDESSLEQMIMNVAVNARDAMPNGGTLTLATASVTLQPEDCKALPEARPGRFVCLTVADTGIGMDESILQHIFEPFFTTKEAGKGTGLGLAVVYGIVQQHEGWISVESQPGQGATFRIYLPAALGKPQAEQPPATPLQELQGRGQRILLVEDEEAVRTFAKSALERNGYAVAFATNAREALDLFDRESASFQLVLSDVVLPDTSGIQLADQLRARQPGLSVILTSGYADQKSQWPLILDRGFPFLQKPYALTELLSAIRDAIAAPRPA